MANYLEVDASVLGLAAEIISHHHLALLDAKIGFIFQEEAGKKAGKIVLGNASKVTEKQKVAGLDLDFIITLAFDYWIQMALVQKKALIDHELCHCDFSAGEAKMRGHDIEEFQCIIDRYGLWKDDLVKIAPSFQEAISQMTFIESKPKGEIVAIKSDSILEE